MRNKKLIGLLALVMFIVAAIAGASEATNTINSGLLQLSTSNYAKVFTLTSGRYTGLYSNPDLTNRISSTAWTGEDDEVWLIGVGRNSRGISYARIKYPVGSSRVEAYMNLRDTFVSGTLTGNARRATASFYGLAKRRGESRVSYYGIDAGDSVYLLTKENGWCQVLYPVGSIWRIAWLTEDEYKGLFPVNPVSNPREKVVSYAYEVLNYEWETPANQYVLLYYNAYSPSSYNGLNFDGANPVVATGRIRGIPYTLGYGNIQETPFASYKALSASDKVTIGDIYSYGGSRVSMKYGMSCATFVTDCMRQGLGISIATHADTGIENASGWKNYVTTCSTNTDADYRKLQKGDYLYTYSHVMLVVANTGSSITVIQQTPPDYTRNNCSNKRTVTASLTYNGVTRSYTATQVCMECAACKKATIGTQETTYSYASLRNSGYYPRFVIYPENEEPELPNPPEITEVLMDQVITGENINFQCKANGSVTSWSASSLPSGLSINETTGVISGAIPSTTQSKNSSMSTWYSFTITAKNSGGSSQKQGYIVVYEPPSITTSALSSATVNSSYSQTIRADGTEKTMKWKLIGSLPPGLTFTGNNNKRTATISGKPTQAGTYSFKIQCSNFEHLPVTTTVKEFTITVKGRDPWLDSNLKLVYIFRNGKVGQYYSDWVRTDVKTFSSYSYSGNLPDGLKLTCSGKQIYLKGTPTKAGTYTFRIYVFGNDGGYNYKDFTVTITGQSTPFEDTSMSISWLLVSGKQYIYYNDYVQVNGGSSAYTPSIVSGALPSGLSLVQSGAKTYVRGSSSRTGTFYFRLRVTGSHGGYAEKDLSITLKPSSSYMAGAPEDGSAKKPKISSTKLNNATIDQEWSHTLEAYGTQPITWLAEGEWPEGFEIDSQAGTITGIPTEVGKLRFKVKAENEIGYTIKTLKLKVVGERPSIETQGLPDGFVGVSYDVQLEASGTDPLRWKKSGSLPSGLKLNTKEGRIYGTPKRAGVYDFTLRVKNKAGTTERSDFRITILAEEPTKEDEATTEQNNNTTSSSAPTVETTQDNTRNSGGAWPEYTDLFMLSDDKKLSGAVTRTSEGALKFAVDQWVDESGNAVKVSDVKIFLNDNELEGVEISDEGVFTLSEDLLATLSKDFTIYALANAGGLEIKTNEVNVTSSAYDEEHGTSGGGCSTGLAGLSLLALLGFATEKRKR